jgi:ATP-binding cassette subfamily A (ABC1) protein 3
MDARLSMKGPREDSILLVKDLAKNYKDLKAVDRLSFGVRRGECFGLLGVNGAGKTTTFKMLTGDEVIDGGSSRLMGFDLQKDRKKFLQNIGYCPQFNSIIEVMTGEKVYCQHASKLVLN